MKILKWFLIITGVLIILYLSGPEPEKPNYHNEFPVLTNNFLELEDYVLNREAVLPLREDNQARIIWAEGNYNKTEYVFLYLHGFSASPMEGYPVHMNIAAHYKTNLYLGRMAGHGYNNDNQLINFTAEAAWERAKEELAVAEKLGDKVIIMSTSTGSPLALKLASEFPDKVFALINLSPNIAIKTPAARILNDPWGKQIAAITFGKERIIHHPEKEAHLYWDTIYKVEALVELENLLETTMSDELFQKVICPVLSLYYYKNEEEQDKVVDVSAIPPMHEALATPDDKKVQKALSTPGNHVIGSVIKSKDTQVVEEEIIKFCDEVLGMSKK